MYLPSKRVLSSGITALRFEEQMKTIVHWASRRESRTVCVANVHMVMEAYWQPKFAQILHNADLVTPDGMPLVWMLQKMGVPQDRVAGMDILIRLCQLAPLQNVSIFFLGSDDETLEAIGNRLNQEFSSLKVAGLRSLPFRPLTPDEDEKIIQEINDSGAGIVFVSLGCPKQERFMAQHHGKIHAVMIGVGAVFPLYAGQHTRAPLWVREAGLEWFYRLVQEPNRLWKRYRETIPPFVWLALKQLVKEAKQDQLISRLPTYRPVGQTLLEAGLLSPEQVRIILEMQAERKKQRFGELLAQQGWLHPQTIDFFAEEISRLAIAEEKKPIGYYLKSAALLNDEQVEIILDKQRRSSLRFGELAIQEGWIKPATINLLLEYIQLKPILNEELCQNLKPQPDSQRSPIC
ncbi:MAG: WecB/TagA/CpsF family glycosyltransferase [Cyanobacteriota bacterium]|nr:WecB/TagA/CpsF family glycosyltransferase [Cyanobacteriota bacterium]